DRHFGITRPQGRAGNSRNGLAVPGSPIQPMGDLMKLRRRAVTGLAIAVAVLVPAAGTATAAAAATYTPLPAHVYAPYYETYLAPNTPSITATAQASGAKYFTLAFLQSTGKNSCALDWNGNSAQPLNYYASDIASLRAMGGDVIPSFGGYSADHTGTEIADSCKNASQIAADYEQVITTLGVTRLDMDVESSSLNNTAGIGRRNQAIAMTEQWATANGIPLQIQYTLPVEQYGLDPNGEAVLQSAAANDATVTSVDIMVFDYYIAKEGVVQMGQAAINAATNTHTQLQSIFPALTPAQLWNMEAMTMLPGIDDLRKKTEVTYEPDATTMLNFAQSNNMNLLSIWAIQRDNGGCPGTVDSNTCSGITQDTWDFSHILEPFTG
ncbi:MAG: chitinase, partial [Actinobacteria bacterium]|nr:chitinase [Actinomycetota bacterium]